MSVAKQSAHRCRAATNTSGERQCAPPSVLPCVLLCLWLRLPALPLDAMRCSAFIKHRVHLHEATNEDIERCADRVKRKETARGEIFRGSKVEPLPATRDCSRSSHEAAEKQHPIEVQRIIAARSVTQSSESIESKWAVAAQRACTRSSHSPHCCRAPWTKDVHANIVAKTVRVRLSALLATQASKRPQEILQPRSSPFEMVWIHVRDVVPEVE